MRLLLVIVSVAFYTLFERKTLGYLQGRKGPNKPGVMGLFVPFADAIKLVTKEHNYPHIGNRVLFIFVPILSLIVPILMWYRLPSFKFSIL